MAAYSLVLRSLGFTDRVSAAHFRLPPGEIRVFVYAETPEMLSVEIDESNDQIGFVLYSWNFQTASLP